MLNSIQAAQLPHLFIYTGWEVRTSGNKLAHAVLRGAFNQYGQAIPNYHYEDLIRCAELYQKRKLAHPTIIVDTNHSNSAKQFQEQPRIAMEVLHSAKNSPTLRKMVRGLMIESYLVEGAQEVTGTVRGKSITDPCLGWETTERLILDIAEYLATF